MTETTTALQTVLDQYRQKLMEKEEQCPEALQEGARALRLAVYGLQRELRKENPDLQDYIRKVTTEESSSKLIRYDTQRLEFSKAADKIVNAMHSGVLPTLEDLLDNQAQ